MGYKIAYEKGGKVKFYTENNRKLQKKAATFSCLLILVAVLIYAGAGKYLRSFFMPGVTDAAFTALADDIRSGEGISDAVTAFCMDIIENAKTTD